MRKEGPDRLNPDPAGPARIVEMTFMVKGKQYIVAVGARNHPSEYGALSLP